MTIINCSNNFILCCYISCKIYLILKHQCILVRLTKFFLQFRQ